MVKGISLATSIVALIATPVAAQPAYDLSHWTLTDLGGVLEGGVTGDITWSSGTQGTDIIPIGTFLNTELPNFSLDQILIPVGLTSAGFSLADFPLLEELSLNQLLDAVPALASAFPLDVPAIKDLLGIYVNPMDLLGTTIGEIVSSAGLGEISLGELTNLSDYGLDSIPGLTSTPLNQFEGWFNQTIAEIPGLNQLPLEMFIDFSSLSQIALLDVPFHDVEAYRTNTITGSYQEGFAVPCTQPDCAHIELGQPQLGKQWISGNSQWVRGGTGCLVGQEPTGRHPFGDGFKVVLTNTVEGQGHAEFSLYFRYCIPCGCSPYLIGPFFYYSANEKDPIVTGTFY